jgi:hypothetical protein
MAPTMKRADLELEIDVAIREAKAEKFFAKLRPHAPNPWAGASKRLSDAERNLRNYDEQQDCNAFEKLLVTYEADRDAASEVPALKAKAKEIESAINALHVIRPRAKYDVISGQFSDERLNIQQLIFSGPKTAEEHKIIEQYEHLRGRRTELCGQWGPAEAAFAKFESDHPEFAAYGRQLDAQLRSSVDRTDLAKGRR